MHLNLVQVGCSSGRCFRTRLIDLMATKFFPFKATHHSLSTSGIDTRLLYGQLGIDTGVGATTTTLTQNNRSSGTVHEDPQWWLHSAAVVVYEEAG